MENWAGELSIGGIFAILVIKLVLDFIKWWSERGKVGKAHAAETGCLWGDAKLHDHVQMINRIIEADPPRRHTDLLKEILTEIKALRSDIKQGFKPRSDT